MQGIKGATKMVKKRKSKVKYKKKDVDMLVSGFNRMEEGEMSMRNMKRSQSKSMLGQMCGA